MRSRKLNGKNCNVDPDIPEGHVALWFGDTTAKRISQGGTPKSRAEAWTVPTEHCEFMAIDLEH